MYIYIYHYISTNVKHENHYNVMQIPVKLQVYTKCSGHETLEGCENKDLAAENKVKISSVTLFFR